MADDDQPHVDGIRRQARQRLESLRRAGLDRVSRPAASRPSPGQAQPIEPPAKGESSPITIAGEPRSRPASSPPPPAARSLFEGNEQPLGPAIPPDQRAAALQVVEREVAGCTRCPQLAATRNRTVFGEGSPTARLLFIGEAPGADEDRTGRPFVGRAGQLLTDMITKGMGLARDDVYIANIIKCRPPDNRVPLADEVASCRGYLERQLEFIRPELLCLLGKTAAATLLDDVGTTPMSKLRGRWFRVHGIRTLVTFHPAYLLRNPASKRDTWEDLKLLMAELGIEPPRKPG